MPRWCGRVLQSLLLCAVWLAAGRPSAATVAGDSCISSADLVSFVESFDGDAGNCSALLVQQQQYGGKGDGGSAGGPSFCARQAFAPGSVQDPAVLHRALECLHGRSEVTVLDLHGNFVRSVSGEPMGQLAASLPSLEELDLGDNALGKAGAEAVAFAVMRHPRLRRVSLAKNFLDAAVVKDSVAFLLLFSPALEELDLSDNRIEGGLGRGVLLGALDDSSKRAGVAAGGRPSALRSFACNRCRLDAASWAELAALVRQNRPVLNGRLELAGNNAGAQGAAALAAALAHNTHLTHLGLAGNRLQDTGAAALAAGALHAGTALTGLDLSGNYIADTGAQAVAAAAEEHGLRLELLQLGKNEVGDAGARALLPTFRRLAGVGPHPGIVLPPEAHANSGGQPLTLELHGNRFSSAVAREFLAVFRRSWGRRALVLSLCGVGSTGLSPADCAELRDAHAAREAYRARLDAPWVPAGVVFPLGLAAVAVSVALRLWPGAARAARAAAGVCVAATTCSVTTMAVTKSAAVATGVAIDSEMAVVALAAVNALLVLGVALTAAARSR